jgi:hypothetical protein
LRSWRGIGSFGMVLFRAGCAWVGFSWRCRD